MVTARSWTRPSTRFWKSRRLMKSNEEQPGVQNSMPKARFVGRQWSVVRQKDTGQRATHDEQIPLPHDRGLSRRGQDDVRGQTRRKTDEARAARRPDHERPGERTGRYSDVAFARVRHGRNSGRLFLLSV